MTQQTILFNDTIKNNIAYGDQLKTYMESRLIVKVNWCGDEECATNIKDQVSGEIRGTRWDIEEKPTGSCIFCKDDAKYVAYVSRTY